MFTVIENRVGHVGTDQVALILIRRITWRIHELKNHLATLAEARTVTLCDVVVNKDADWSKRKARVESKVQIKILRAATFYRVIPFRVLRDYINLIGFHRFTYHEYKMTC